MRTMTFAQRELWFKEIPIHLLKLEVETLQSSVRNNPSDQITRSQLRLAQEILIQRGG